MVPLYIGRIFCKISGLKLKNIFSAWYFAKKNIAMIQSKHCDELIETMRWFNLSIAMVQIVHRNA